LVSFLFAVFLLTVLLRAQLFVKVGARAPVPHGVGATVCYVAERVLFNLGFIRVEQKFGKLTVT